MSTKRIYLIIEASNQKNKTTLFSSTLKVQESKPPLFSQFEALFMSYERFLTYSFIILVKFSVGGGRGSRTIFFNQNFSKKP